MWRAIAGEETFCAEFLASTLTERVDTRDELDYRVLLCSSMSRGALGKSVCEKICVLICVMGNVG